MRGLVLERLRTVAYRTDVADPVLRQPTDALIRVQRTGLCGSDLHPYEGREAVRYGVVGGHEAMGEVISVGTAVTAVRPGDRVLVPFTTSCGRCAACRRGLSARCREASLFGYADPAGDAPPLHGAQAELLRVPLADSTVVAVPAGVSDVEAVLLTDNFPTGWFAVERADIPAGGAVAVVGLGSVGLCAVAAAIAQGAPDVVAVDPVADRRERAALLGAQAMTPDDAAAAGLAVPSVVEAAGTRQAQELAFSLLDAGGTLSVIAVQTDAAFGFTPIQAYDRNVTVRVGRAPVRSVLQRLLPLVAGGDVRLPTDVVVTHPQLPLEHGPQANDRFAAREPGLVKVMFVP